MVVQWTFCGFVDDKGRNVIDDWYDTLPASAQAKLDWLIKMFESRRQSDWIAKYFKPYTGYEDIYEFRFDVDGIFYRPLGAFGPKRSEYTILMPATKKDKKILIPKDAPEIAMKRLDIVRDDATRARECEFETEEREISQEVN